MQLYMSWYIRSFFGFTFLNILYFFKYSCTNIFHRRSLYTFYYNSLLSHLIVLNFWTEHAVIEQRRRIMDECDLMRFEFKMSFGRITLHKPGLLNWHGLTLPWISNFIHDYGWDEITYAFTNINGCTLEVWIWISNFIPYFTGYVIMFHAGIKVKPC